MAVFLVRYTPNGPRRPLADESAALAPYLPPLDYTVGCFSTGPCEALVFTFDAALDRPPTELGPKDHVFCHGYGDASLEPRIARRLKSRLAFDLDGFPEAFCAIHAQADGIAFGSSAAGADALFYCEVEGSLFVTNRHNLLGHWVSHPTLRKSAFAWMLGRSHIGDFGTYWQQIKRTRPGSAYLKTANSPLVEVQGRFTNAYGPIPDAEINMHLAAVGADFCTILENSKAPAQFLLSGGKDSRAIAGMLSQAGNFQQMDFQTYGEPFAPDVMSARTVAQRLGVAARHSISDLSITGPKADMELSIAQDLVSDCAGGALADFRKITSATTLTFGGHENGHKRPPNSLTLDDYLKTRKYWCDNTGILMPEAYAEINGWYMEALRAHLADAPQARYAQLDMMVFRNGTYLSAPFANTHVSGSEIHPFLQGKMASVLLGVSDAALTNQLIHYVMMRQSSHVLESLPFAADAWPDATVEMARNIGLPFREAAKPPYRFQPYFPSQQVFGGYAWRLDLMRKARPFLMSYLQDHRDFFDFLNFDRMMVVLNKPEQSLELRDFYLQLSLLKAALVHYFSASNRLFRFDQVAEMAADLSQLLRPTATQDSPIAALQKVLDSYGKALAQVAERDHHASAAPGLPLEDAVEVLLKYLPDQAEVRAEALHALGVERLEKAGLCLGRTGDSATVHGFVVCAAPHHNKVLLALKDVAKSASVPGFALSEGGGFWFRYIPTKAGLAPFSIDIPALESGCEIWLLPWYSPDPIWAKAHCQPA